MSELSDEVKRFKNWAANGNYWSVEETWLYKRWDEFFDAAITVMDQFREGDIPTDLVDDLLFAIAMDEECEDLAEHLVDAPLLLRTLAKAVVNHGEPDAKWLIAKSVAEANLDDAADLIRPLLKDSCEYVRRRSLMAFAPFSPSEAEAIAIADLSDDFEYTRMVAISVLHTVRSPQLGAWLDQLENDTSEYVRHKVQELRSAANKP